VRLGSIFIMRLGKQKGFSPFIVRLGSIFIVEGDSKLVIDAVEGRCVVPWRI